ncbi:hypothetical protein CVT24_010438 [Panaeolus cyanescens]|uniref:Uncharacterized protein n=1 Tax=Panaeolus cyanescens TaxID=181874 RepID=A0A409YPQ0_9AGAR|nr:hypothetical protein CVT24_010438 [Panaeolus cyanescens]
MSLCDSPLKENDIVHTIGATFSALSRHGLEGCLIGSAAAYFYGMRYRVPNDLDVVVVNPSPEHTTDDIKDLIAQSDKRFSLVPSRVPGSVHQVMWFSIEDVDENDVKSPSKKSRVRAAQRQRRQDESEATRLCKVDILIPSIYFGSSALDSFSLVPDHSTTFESHCESDSTTYTPTMQTVKYVPLPTLILLKLSAWKDCSAVHASQKLHEAIPKHELDIEQLLHIIIMAAGNGAAFQDPPFTNRSNWTLAGFPDIMEVRRCIAKYVKKWPRTSCGWFTVLKAFASN